MDVNSLTELHDVDGKAVPLSKSERRRQPKEIWIICHRWIGIIAGLPIALIGLTGSLIYLAPMFLALQHGNLLSQPDSNIGSYQPAAAWVDAVRKANGSGLEIIAVSAPNKSPIAAETAQVVGHTHEGAEGDYHRVFSVDPVTAQVKGHYDFETSYAYVPVGIHTSLMIPMVGLDVVAIIGVVILFSSISGIYL